MGTLAAGQVVVLPFPFSDLSRKNCAQLYCWQMQGEAAGSPAKLPATLMQILKQSHWQIVILPKEDCSA